jgi:hypothetical protein
MVLQLVLILNLMPELIPVPVSVLMSVSSLKGDLKRR